MTPCVVFGMEESSVMATEEEIRVAVRKMEAEHQNLEDRLQHLKDGLLAGKKSEVLVERLIELIRVIKVHQEHEEELLAKAGFPGSEEHHIAHDQLLANVLKLQARFMSDTEEPFTMESLHSIQKWLEEHFAEVDKEYLLYLHASVV